MKKIFLVTLTSFVAILAGAQIQFGVKAGLNLANLSFSPAESGASFSMKPDFNAGALVFIPINEMFALQPEVMFSGQGSKVKAEAESGTYNFNYINIPVLAKYHHASGFFAELGPQVGFNISAKAKAMGQSTDLKENVKSADFSGVVGLGFLSSINLGVDARYNLGFANIAKEASGVKIKNNVIQVSVFYMFGGQKK